MPWARPFSVRRHLGAILAAALAASCQFPRYEIGDESGSDAGEGGSGGIAPVAGATSSGSSSGGVAGGGAQAGVGGSVMPLAGSTNEAGAPAGGGAGGDPGEPTDGGAGGAPPEPQPVELAQGKPVTGSSQQGGNEVAKGNDGATGTRWCADSSSLPQWWRVDLGSERLLTSFSVHWEHGDRAYSYLIETSNDDALFTTRVSNTAAGLVQTADFPTSTRARYVRVTVTGANPAGWASFYELSLWGF